MAEVADATVSAKLDELLRIGNKIRIVYAPSSPKKTRVVHIREIVDLAVYIVCWWNKKAQAWSYECMHYVEFEVLVNRLESAGLSGDYEFLANYRKEHPGTPL